MGEADYGAVWRSLDGIGGVSAHGWLMASGATIPEASRARMMARDGKARKTAEAALARAVVWVAEEAGEAVPRPVATWADSVLRGEDVSPWWRWGRMLRRARVGALVGARQMAEIVSAPIPAIEVGAVSLSAGEWAAWCARCGVSMAYPALDAVELTLCDLGDETTAEDASDRWWCGKSTAKVRLRERGYVWCRPDRVWRRES